MQVDKGYILLARKIDDSDIAYKPPHFREIWLWLLRQANHKDNGTYKRGQCLRSFRDIQEGLKWYVGYRKMTYSKDQCEKAMKYLRNRGMIATTKATRGLLITILNYDTYQDPKKYESNKRATAKATREQQGGDTINKNEKNEIKKSIKEHTQERPNLKNQKAILFQKEIDRDFKEVAKMRKQITDEQFERITKKYKPEEIRNILRDMENKTYSYLKKYSSVGLTLESWLRRSYGG